MELVVIAVLICGMPSYILPVDGCGSAVRSDTPTPCFSTSCFNGQCTLGEARFSFSCACDAGWTGASCDLCCDLSCLPNGTCAIDESQGRMYCDCLPHLLCDDDADFTPDVFMVTEANESQNSTYDYYDYDWEIQNETETKGSVGSTYCHGIWVPDARITFCDHFPCHHGRCEARSLGVVCVCDPGWGGDTGHCDICCDWECSGRGDCVAYDTEPVIRQCVCADGNYTSESNCTEMTTVPPPLPPRSPDWLWYIVGVAVVLSLVLLLVLLIVPVYLWQHRHVFILRIVHYLQKYDDPNRPYHVFISYMDHVEDERFVIRELLPKLERDMQLKVCVLARDAIPGAPITDTILSAVMNSSRTILVVSPEYCRGEWPSFEYRVAVSERSKLRHKIVPIIFKPVDDVRMDDLLQFILDSAKTLKWPHGLCEDQKLTTKAIDKFWTKLRLQMPKVKIPETQQHEIKAPETKSSRGLGPDHILDVATISSERMTGKTISSSLEFTKSTDVRLTDITLDSGYISSASLSSNL